MGGLQKLISFWVDLILTTGEYRLRVFIEREKNSYYLLYYMK
jgi:hypothetical protein